MGFQQGLSGLSAASQNLEVISNNIANSSTVGFKGSQAQFAEVYANSLSGGGSAPIGIGTKVSNISQQFSQGNITASNNPLDIAINGKGFFRVSSNGAITYSRNGQFQLDQKGYLVNTNQARLTGYPADAKGTLLTGSPVDLNINTADTPAKISTQIDLQLNIDSRQPVLPTSGFLPTDPTTYTHATATTVYDSLGNTHNVQSFYVKTASNTWDVYATNDGTLVSASPIGTLHFKTDGSINTATTTLPFNVPLAVTTGATTPFTVKLNLASSTQFGSNFGVNALSQDGYASGRLASFSTGLDGIIKGVYTNGQTATLGQVVLANFVNPNGLQAQGNNVWAETANSGPALVGTPNAGGNGVLQSSAREDSNVDLTSELVNLITAQRFYQANAQTIKTQDAIYQTLVNLR